MPKHQAPDTVDEPARSSEIALQAGASPSRPSSSAQGASSAGSPITPEVLLFSMGGPARTPLQDTLHKVAMLSSARWGSIPAKTLAERRPSIGVRVAVVAASATGIVSIAVHWGWMPFP